MPLLAVSLVLISCLLHATWNLWLKRAHDKMAFTALSLCVSTVLYFPMYLYYARSASVSLAGWACIASTGFAYFAYFAALAVAYQHGDLSHVYPVSRGLGPALTFLAGIVFLSERPRLMGSCGVVLIIAGILVLHLQGRRKGVPRKKNESTALFVAAFVGLMISVYSLIDKIGVDRLRLPPPLYTYLTYTLAAVLVTAWVWLHKGGYALKKEWTLNAGWCIGVGALSLFTYMLVLFAMALPGTPVGYIVPLRSTSVLFGIFFGVRVLNEGRLPQKLAGTLLMILGIVLIAWKG
jgi:uncharacterized membrane protein